MERPRHLLPPEIVLPLLTIDVRRAFLINLRAWKEATKFMSSVSDMAEHPTNRTLMSMGEVVLPLLLEELELDADHYFSNLRELTGVEMKFEKPGSLREMQKAWVAWGRETGYLPPEPKKQEELSDVEFDRVAYYGALILERNVLLSVIVNPKTSIYEKDNARNKLMETLREIKEWERENDGARLPRAKPTMFLKFND